MTVLLVLFTLIAFLIADYIVQRKKQLKHATVPGMQFLSSRHHGFSNDIALAPNHLWIRRERDNSITVGIDEFITGLTGALERIDLPNEGEIVGRGKPRIRLQEKNKSLRIDSPIEGQVKRVNADVLHSPVNASNHPYTSGWLFNLIPADEAKTLTGFLRGDAAMKWMKKQNEAVKEFLTTRAPQPAFATMQDGGLPVDGALKGFDNKVWEEFNQRFISLPAQSKQPGDYDNA